MSTCDKCGQDVPTWNDATIIEAEAFDSPMTALVNSARHFLPVFEGKTLVCEGSPSRYQYLPYMPKDTRYGFYAQEHENTWRKGFNSVIHAEAFNAITARLNGLEIPSDRFVLALSEVIQVTFYLGNNTCVLVEFNRGDLHTIGVVTR